MKIIVKTHNVKLTKSLKEYATKKMEKLTKFFDNIQDVVVELHMEDTAAINQRQLALVTVHASGTVIRAEETSQDLYASIDLVFDNLGRQLRKHKERLRDHKKDLPGKRLIADSSDEVSVKKSKMPSAFSPDDLFEPKPLEIEEASRQMRENRLPFLVFRNFKTEKINVVYPTGTSSFGIIDPA